MASIGDQIAWMDRLQAAGVAPTSASFISALGFARDERDRLYAVPLRDRPLRGDPERRRRHAAHRAGAPRDARRPDGECDSAESQMRSAREIFSQPVVDAIQSGYKTARDRHERGVLVEKAWTETLANYLAPGAEHATISTRSRSMDASKSAADCRRCASPKR